MIFDHRQYDAIESGAPFFTRNGKTPVKNYSLNRAQLF